MLNPFPELLVFEIVIITFLRIVVAILYLHFGFGMLFRNREQGIQFFKLSKLPYPIFWLYLIGGMSFIGGLLLLAGVLVQYVALALSIVSFGALILKDRNHPHLENGPEFYMLLFAITFSLLFFGAGAFSFDLPL